MKRRPLIIGLTGSIGMGKSTAAKVLSGFGLPVHNADAAVHALLSPGSAAVKPVARLFPNALKRGGIDRALLGKEVFGAPKKLKELEGILHPLVGKKEREFLRRAQKDRAPAVVLDIPLLFETGAEARCDVTLCVTASKIVQKERVLKRHGMDAARFRAILKQQMPDKEKRSRADFVINTSKGMADTKRQLAAFWIVLQEGE